MSRASTKIDEIRRAIREEIHAGVYGDDGKLPSEPEAAKRFGCARLTVREAYRQLVLEGLIVNRPKRGYYVRLIRPLSIDLTTYEQGDLAAGRDGLDQWATLVANAGRMPHAPTDVAIMAEDAEFAPLVRELLGLPDPDESSVVVRRRTCYVDEEPWITRDSYFPEPLVRGTRLMKPGDQVAAGGLFAEAGIMVTRFVDRQRARIASQEEAERLELPPGTPGTQWIRIRYGHSGAPAGSEVRPLAVMVAFLPGDRVELTETVDVAAAG
jgi:GntR family transcriptional regulator